MQALVGRVADRRFITYGANPQADVRAENIVFEGGGARFDIVFRERNAVGLNEEAARIADVVMPMPGVHNVLNALAAAAVARRIGASHEAIKSGFAKFAGVKRRFTRVGEWRGVHVIDDYGHHPVEIAAVLRAARNVASGKIIAVVQPHRYSRLQNLFDDFCACLNEADIAVVTDVYAAGEAPLEGFDKARSSRALRNMVTRTYAPFQASTNCRRLSQNSASLAIMSCASARAISPATPTRCPTH